MWKYNPSPSEWNTNIYPPDSTGIYHIRDQINVSDISQLRSRIPFSLIFLVKWVIRRLVLAYIGFREHNTSNFPPKLHNSLQFLNISIWVIIFFTNKNTYRIVFDSILLRVSKLPEIYFPVQWHNSTSQVSKSSKLVTICERGLLKWCQMLQIHFPNCLP